MSCPIHDRCTCYGASLQYAASLTTTTTDSSQFPPQTNNIFVGYEWAAPLVATSATWSPLESMVIQPPMSHSGRETLQSDRSRHENAYGTLPVHNVHRRPHVRQLEQKSGPPSREQVHLSFPILRPSPRLTPSQIAAQHPYPTPYIQGVTRIAMPSSYSQSSVSLRQAHQTSTLGFTGFDEFSQVESVKPDPSTMFDEPPPPYPNNTLLVSPLSDAFPPSALLSTDLLNLGSITPSPLAPVPLRHSSLYQVLKHDTPALPGQGTVQSGVSSIAHALQPQELQARQALPMRTPVLGNTRSSTIGASESALAATQVASTSPATVVVDLCSALPQIPTVAPSARAQPPVSSATPPCAPVPQAENGSVVTPLGGHTLAQSLPEVTIHDYDTLPRLRKVSPPGPC
jgi:hypothetical protein